MNLAELIERFSELDGQIVQCVQEECHLQRLGDLDREIADVSEAIREFNPDSISELKRKISFYVEQLKREAALTHNATVVQGLVHTLNHDFDFSGVGIDSQSAAQAETDEAQFKMINAYDLVSTSHDRISIIDRNFRYINTSRINGSFYKQKPHEVIGKHVGQMIGKNRFDQRAKRFFEKSFGGQKQKYFHSLETEEGCKIFSCEMLPLYGSESNVFGTMVAMSDITDLVANADRIVLAELEQAA